MRIHVFHHLDAGSADPILSAISELSETMSVQLDALRLAVTKIENAADAQITLLRGLAAQIAALKTDPAALQALADEVSAKADVMAAETVANTGA